MELYNNNPICIASSKETKADTATVTVAFTFMTTVQQCKNCSCLVDTSYDDLKAVVFKMLYLLCNLQMGLKS
jgi:hypothetical protein